MYKVTIAEQNSCGGEMLKEFSNGLNCEGKGTFTSGNSIISNHVIMKSLESSVKNVFVALIFTEEMLGQSF